MTLNDLFETPLGEILKGMMVTNVAPHTDMNGKVHAITVTYKPEDEKVLEADVFNAVRKGI